MTRETNYCDRCGAKMPNSHFLRAKRHLRGTLYFGNGAFEYLDESYDMCKKCCEAFRRFMKGGEGE